MHGVNITAVIDLISGTQKSSQHALCDTEVLSSAIGSMNYIRFHDTCALLTEGDVATTDDYGNATFSNFTIKR